MAEKRCDGCKHWRSRPSRCWDLADLAVRPSDICDGWTDPASPETESAAGKESGK